MIIKSKLSFWFFHKLLAVYIFISLIFVFLNIEEHPKGQYDFHFKNFLFTQIWAIPVLLIFFLIEYISKKELIINTKEGTLEINRIHSKVIKKLNLTQITNMIWENKNTTFNLRYKKESSNQKSFTLSFSDGSSLHIDGTTYLNFFEIQGFFLTYCNNHNIIKISPLNARKRRHLRLK